MWNCAFWTLSFSLQEWLQTLTNSKKDTEANAITFKCKKKIPVLSPTGRQSLTLKMWFLKLHFLSGHYPSCWNISSHYWETYIKAGKILLQAYFSFSLGRFWNWDILRKWTNQEALGKLRWRVCNRFEGLVWKGWENLALGSKAGLR